jgi:hypothetical protein
MANPIAGALTWDSSITANHEITPVLNVHKKTILRFHIKQFPKTGSENCDLGLRENFVLFLSWKQVVREILQNANNF